MCCIDVLFVHLSHFVPFALVFSASVWRLLELPFRPLRLNFSDLVLFKMEDHSILAAAYDRISKWLIDSCLYFRTLLFISFGYAAKASATPHHRELVGLGLVESQILRARLMNLTSAYSISFTLEFLLIRRQTPCPCLK